MAEPITVKVVYDGAQANAGLDETKSKLGGTGEAAEGMGSSWGNMSQQITAGIMVAQAAIAMFAKLASAIADVAGEIERQAAIMNRLAGSIDEAAERTSNMVSQIDLMGARNRIARAGLELTEHQFANIAVAAEDAAAGIGDGREQMTRLARAIATGQTGALREFGIELEGITGQANIQRAALEGLEQKFGTMTTSADTLAGRLAGTDVALKNVWTEIIRGHTLVPTLVTEWDKLTDAVDDTDDAMTSVLSSWEEFGIKISSVLEFAAREMREFGEDAQAVGRLLAAAASNDFAAGRRALDAWEAQWRSRLGQLGLVDLTARNVLAAAAQREEDTLQRDTENAKRNRNRNRNRNRGGTGASGRDPFETAPVAFSESDVIAGLASQEDALRAVVDKEAERLLMLKEQNLERERQAELEQQINDITSRTIEGQQALAGIISIVAKGGEDQMEAIQALLASSLDRVGQELIAEGVKSVLVGSVLSAQLNPLGPGVVAGGFAEIAAGAGFTAAGSAIAVPAAASAQPAPGGGPSGGGDVTIMQNFNAPMDPEDMGIMNRRSERAAQRATFGGRL